MRPTTYSVIASPGPATDMSPSAQASSLPKPGADRTEARYGATTVALGALTAILAILVALEAAGVTNLDAPRLLGSMMMLCIPGILAWRQRRFAPFGAEVTLPLAVHLTTLQGAIGRTLAEADRSVYESRVLEVAVYSSFCVGVVTVVLSKAFGGRGLMPKIPAYTVEEARRRVGLGIMACAITVGLFASWAVIIGYDRLAQASYGEIYTIGAEQGTFMTFAWPLYHLGPALLWRGLSMWPGEPPRVYRITAYVFMAVFVLISARMGVRGPILQVFAAVGIARLGTLRPMKLATIVFATLAMLALSVFIFGMRTDLSQGFRADRDLIERSASHTLDAKSHGEFEGIFNNHVEMVRVAGSAFPYREGVTYVDAIKLQIPRQFVGEKPLGLTAWWVRYLDWVAANAGAGFAFGAFTEGYLNFGPAGAVAQIVALTLCLGLAYRGLSSKSIVGPGMAAVTLCYAYHFQRTDLGYVLFVVRNIILVGVGAFALDYVYRGLWRGGHQATKTAAPPVATPLPARAPAPR